MIFDAIYIWYLRNPLQFQKRRILEFVRSILPLKTIRFTTPSGIRMELDPTDFVQTKILIGGSYEPRTLALVSELLPTGGTFVDVGGHVGQFALEAAQAVGNSGRVVVIEPNPRTFQYLFRNIKLNNFTNITPVIGAVSTRSDFVNMAIPPEDNWGASREEVSGETPGYIVPSFCLETLLDDLKVKTINVVKIDVEGFECNVLEGLLASGRFRPDNIILEHIPRHFESSLRVPAILKSQGYDVYNVDGVPLDLDSDPYIQLPEDNLLAKRSQAR